MSLGIHDQNSRGGVKLGEIFCDADLLGALREPVLGFHLWAIVGSSLQPFDVIVDGIASRCALRKWLEVILCQPLGSLNACVDVITLREIDVLEEVAADSFR